MTQAADAYDLLRRIRMDLSDLQQRITDLTNVLNDLHVEDTPRPTCPDCMLTFRWASQLDEHLYHAHAGPPPPHWVAAEARAEP